MEIIPSIISDRGFPIFSIQFSKDNNGFYFISQHASDPKWNGAGISELYYYTIAANTYKKVNLKSYFRQGTVEFRQHSGTVEFKKIKRVERRQFDVAVSFARCRHDALTKCRDEIRWRQREVLIVVVRMVDNGLLIQDKE